MDKTDPIISLEYKNDITVATLTRERILEDTDIQQLEDALLPLIQQNENINLLIDFSEVKFLSSSVLGLLIRISKKIYEKQGKLTLCSIDQKIYEVFKITRLEKVFDIKQDKQQAIDQL